VSQSFGGRLLVTRTSHDVGTGGGQGVDLGEGAFDVGRLRRCHGLDGDGGITSHGHLADVNLPGRPALGPRPVCVTGRDWRWMGDVEEDGGSHEDDQKEYEGRGHRDQLGHIGVVGLAPTAAEPLVDGDQNVPSVEGKHGDQVDDSTATMMETRIHRRSPTPPWAPGRPGARHRRSTPAGCGSWPRRPPPWCFRAG